MFSDFGIFKLLCQLDEPKILMEYIPESLQRLLSYKKPQQEDLIATLKAYLKTIRIFPRLPRSSTSTTRQQLTGLRNRKNHGNGFRQCE
mgnify:CR=1 FL=1